VIKVGINGYGTIGKRVADAVSLQDDMEVAGVTKTKPDFEAENAIKKGYRLYSAISERLEVFEEKGLKVEGTLGELLERCDVVVDCSPGGYGAKNKEIYERYGVKAVFQGGEKKNIAPVSFVASCNYEKAVGADFIRVVSCNTTGMSRLIRIVTSLVDIGRVRATVVRRAVDPKDDRKGPINAITPNPVSLPSHHGVDVQSVMPDVDIVTTAVKVPTTLMHLHSMNFDLKGDMREQDLIEVLRNDARMMLIHSEDGFTSTARIIEYAREVRDRGDIWENCVWEDSISVYGGELYLFQAIHQEAIVVPENVDAIRALMGFEDGDASIEKTNRTLGL